MRGAGIDAGATVDGGSTGVVAPGSLTPCTALGAVTLTGIPDGGTTWMPAPPWPDGVPYYAQPPAMAVPDAGPDGPPMQGVPEAGGVVLPDGSEPPPVPPELSA